MKLRVAKILSAVVLFICAVPAFVHAQATPPTITSFNPTSGYIGSPIVINGTGFTGTTNVKFNITDANPFTVESSSKINATVASGTTTGTVKVTTPGGTATSSSNFTVVTTKPTLSFSAASVDVAYGGSATLNWTASNVSWCWGYRWATYKVDPDGSGWVQPPDQNTVAGTTVSGTFNTGPLTSDKSYSLICGQPGNPTPLKTVSINVGNQSLSLTGFSPTSGAPDTNVIITGTAFKNISYVRFNGNNAASFKIDSSTQITAVVASGTTTGKITIKNSNDVIVTSASNFTITPQASFTFNPPSPASITAGGEVTLSWTVNAQVTWCWGTGGLWGGGSWVQPPDPTHPGTGGSVKDKPSVTTNYSLTCGAPGNPRPTQSQQVTVTGQPPPPPPTGALPYFQVNRGDIFTGGWFDANSNACSNDEPTYQSPLGWISQDHDQGTKGDHAGAIITYGMVPDIGSRTDQAAYALGGIIHDNTSRYGFMTNTANQRTFANGGDEGGKLGTVTSLWGGLLEGSTKQAHCIPDYYGVKWDLPKVWTNVLKDLPSGQYYVNGTDEVPVTIPESTIETTQNVTIFVNGNAYIPANIVYNIDKETINDIPKFALVVSGNIYIAPAVSQLDGFYVAQPKASDNCDDFRSPDCHGKIFTCHDATDSLVPTKDFLSNNCRRQLTINGAVVAADIEFTRTIGDSTGVFTANKPAEIINFTPEMVLGGSFFHGPSAATSNQSKIDSIISLPPIF